MTRERRRAFARLFARVNICRVFPARDENKLCVTRVRRATDVPEMDFSFDRPGLCRRNWRYRSAPDRVSRLACISYSSGGVWCREAGRVRLSIDTCIIHATVRRADDERCRGTAKKRTLSFRHLYRDYITLPFRRTASSMRSPWRLFNYSRKSE